jgi:predicted nucleic acid-binding protein
VNSLDTNVFVYAVSDINGAKELAAKKLLSRATNAGWPVAAQVYGEFYSLMTRRKYMTRQQALEAVDAFIAVMPPLASSLTAHAAALRLATDKQMQYWDALIVAICAENGVKRLYSEDVPGTIKPLGVECVSPW